MKKNVLIALFILGGMLLLAASAPAVIGTRPPRPVPPVTPPTPLPTPVVSAD